LDVGDTGLLWVTDWSIFPSSENMLLFDTFRRAHGESRRIDEAPGHLFDRADKSTIECLIDLGLYFYWDLSIFDGRGTFIRIDHDDLLLVNTAEIGAATRYRVGIEQLGLLPVGGTRPQAGP
jgi:hypothetical protein